MKCFSFILSLSILVQSFGITTNDFIQLNELIEHAQFHKEHYGDSFFEFVSKHYGNLKTEHNKTHQEENGKHNKLPFQHRASFHMNFFALVNMYETPVFKSHTLVASSNIFFYMESKSSPHINRFLQPPNRS